MFKAFFRFRYSQGRHTALKGSFEGAYWVWYRTTADDIFWLIRVFSGLSSGGWARWDILVGSNPAPRKRSFPRS